MTEGYTPAAVPQRVKVAKAPPVLTTIVKALGKVAVWAVKHPEVIISIARQIRAEDTVKQQQRAIARKPNLQ
jgi:hypothetical protein